MTHPPDARLFLADQRGRSETHERRSLHTFNSGDYVAEGREPFGPLGVFNEEVLRAGARLSLRSEVPSAVLLLPVTGGVAWTYGNQTEYLAPGEAAVWALPAGAAHSVANPYETEFIEYLHLGFTLPPGDLCPVMQRHAFELTEGAGLQPLLRAGAAGPGVRLFLGRFAGREEGTYPIILPAGAGSGVFVFVLQGVFEVANRLLHDRDALALHYALTDELAFEALAPDSLLLVLEWTRGT
jgi:hypothetical protein